MGLRRSALEDLVAAPELTLDVVVCTYNNATLLDETPAVVERQAGRSPVPVSIVSEPEQGLTPARLRGVASTTGDWIAFVDDDCILERDWIERAAEFAAAHPEAGGFGGRVVLDWEQPPREYVTRYGWAFAEQDHGPEPTRVTSLAGAGFVFRRAALEESGWLQRHFLADRVGEKLVSGGDVEMALRVGARNPLWYSPTLRLRHRIPAGRTTLGYVLAVTRGLGTSKLLGDSMLWPGSYRRWVLTSLRASGEWAGAAVRFGSRALLRRGGGKDALVQLSFLRGYLAGIWRLARMDRDERRALLGIAARVNR